MSFVVNFLGGDNLRVGREIFNTKTRRTHGYCEQGSLCALCVSVVKIAGVMDKPEIFNKIIKYLDADFLQKKCQILQNK